MTNLTLNNLNVKPFIILSKGRKKHWETETSEEIVFFKHFETLDSQVCLGDYFELIRTDKNVIFYIQTFETCQISDEPICIYIPNLYWKKLLEFDFSKKMKVEQEIFDKLQMNRSDNHGERWNLLKRAFSKFWKHQHSYFQIDFVKEPTHTRTHCNLYMTLSDINILIDRLNRFDKKAEKQNKKINSIPQLVNPT